MVRGAGSRRQGFTLTEVLVALAIMVILFALLFAPMMIGLEWVATGRAHVGMQDAARLAMEEIRRELGEAVYVPRWNWSARNGWWGASGVVVNGWDAAVFPGADGAWYTGDDVYVPNYSHIFFCPPERDEDGRIIHPPRKATRWEHGRQHTVLVRYAVRLVYPYEEHSEDNPFALYREEFLWDETTGEVGRYDSVGNWEDYQPVAETALTPKRGATFVPTTTVTWSDGAAQPTFTSGYVPDDPTDNVYHMYLFQGVQFVPERMMGEQLTTDNGVIYRSRHGAWDGTPLAYYQDGGGNPYYYLPPYAAGQDTGFRLWRSELDPRISLYRWVTRQEADELGAPGIAGSYSLLRDGMDSRETVTDLDPSFPLRTVALRWSPETGAISVGRPAQTNANRPYRIIGFGPRNAAGWYTVNHDGGIQAVWPSDPGTTVPRDEADAPISYRAVVYDGYGAGYIEPASVKVRVVGYVNGERREIELKPTTNFNQTAMSGDEFCPLLVKHDYNDDGRYDGTALMLRFSRYDPPRPTSRALFGTAAAEANGFEIQVMYHYRRNYTYDPDKDARGHNPFVSDIVKLDYSTRRIQNVTLALQRYTDLIDDGTGALRVPAEERPIEVSVRDRIVVRNHGR